MIQKNTFLKVIDNSGGRLAKCIHVYNNRKGHLGDIILISLRKIKFKQNLFISKIKIEVGSLFRGLILQTVKGINRFDGSKISFNKNSVVLLNRNNNKLIGTRLSCPLIKELKNKKYIKILTIGSKVI